MCNLDSLLPGFEASARNVYAIATTGKRQIDHFHFKLMAGLMIRE
jgi:hypothetical protein